MGGWVGGEGIFCISISKQLQEIINAVSPMD